MFLVDADVLIWERGHELATLNLGHCPMFGGLTTPFELDGTGSPAE
jgi:hypothetical protein